jgi:hypothetical protein
LCPGTGCGPGTPGHAFEQLAGHVVRRAVA